MSREFLAKLSIIFPKDRLLADEAEVIPYESDGLTAFRAKPLAVVIPETQQEIIDAVKLCYQFDIPFVARGSGTSLSGGSTPIANGVVIALNRMNKLINYNSDERVAVVEPGFINLYVTKQAAKDGLYYAPDPSSGPVCTIGGNVAFNSGGAHCLKYGMTSNHVLGLKVVLPDGEVVEFGSESLEAVGPDLAGMFCGSEGLFGIAIEISLRLLPKPEVFKTVLVAYDELAKAGQTVADIVASGLLPGAMEIMDRLAMDAAEAAVKAGYPPKAQGLLIVELEGPAEEVEAETPKLMKVIEASGAYEIRVAKNDMERMKIWKGRKGAFSAVGRLSPDYVVQDGVVPRTKLGEALSEIERLSEAYGLRVANVFHAGDGNLHPLILYNGNVKGEFDKAEELAGDILKLCVDLGGAVTGEHGIGIEKLAYLPYMFDKSDMDLMKNIREAIDTKEIANRGKMLPSNQAPALTMHGAHPIEKEGLAYRE